MLVIRLLRTGKKNQPSFKIVVTDKKNPPRGGRFVEEVGSYNPIIKAKVLKKERIQYWLSQGAQPSDTVHNLLVKEGILEGKKIPVHKKSKKEIKEESVEKSVEAKPQQKSEVKPIEASSEIEPQPPQPAEPEEKKEENPSI